MFFLRSRLAEGNVMQRLSLVWISVLCLSLSAAAQQGDAGATPKLQTHPSLPTSQEEDRTIKFDVVVTDKAGASVPGLQQQDFTVLDNKRPANILSFQAERGAALTPDAETQIVLILDEVNTVYQRVTFERDEVKQFLGQNGGKLAHPVTLVFFSDLGTQIQAVPSSDGNQLIAALDKHRNALRTITRSTGFYGAEDRLKLSLTMLTELAENEQTKPGRKMVIWISPGWPLFSGPNINLSSKQMQAIFNSLVQYSTLMGRARMTLYSVDPLGLADSGGLRTTYYQEFLKGVTGPNQAQMANLSLQVLATRSGGKVLFGNNSIVDGIERCIADLDAFYTLSIAAAPADHANEYHGLEVKVGTRGLTARTRAAYYAQP